MTDDLIAYLMDDLSPERRAEVEAKLATDVVWRWELERLRECMATSDESESCVEPPSGVVDEISSVANDLEPPVDLVKKTCCFVEDSASGKFKVEKQNRKKRAPFAPASCAAARRSWSLADVTVASGVALILAALILPAIQQSRGSARTEQCANNLRALGAASESYAKRHFGFLPTVMRGEPSLVYLTKMVDAQILSPEEAFAISACPDSMAAQRRFASGSLSRLPTTLELSTAKGHELSDQVREANVSFAFPVGYFNKRGEIQPLEFNPGAEQPLVSDAPTIGPTALVSNSHGGCMQNVLSSAGCVKPYALCVLVREDQRMRDIHLNDAGKPAAGNSPDDVFLAPPDYGPEGPIALGGLKSVKVQLYIVPLVAE